MAKKEKKKQKKQPPVATGFDNRAENRQKQSSGSDAPDGVTGNWS